MLRRASRRRSGTTLIEAVVAMLIGGMVLGLVASISVRQQRIYADIAQADALAAQLRDASAVLPIDLRAAASSAGDIRSGEARDTSLEIRGTIASAVVCDTTATSIVLAPAAADSAGGAFTSVLTSVQIGDTAWLFTPNDSVDDWVAHRISAVATAAPRQCASPGPWLDAAAVVGSRTVVTLDELPVLSSALGRPIRVTRPLRYSLYRAGDGAWYLGERDWNTTSGKFNTIQPVSGPYLSASSRGLTFRYSDSAGVALSTPVADSRAIALIRIDLRGATRAPVRALGATGPAGPRVDSVSIAVHLHNRK